MKKTFGYTGASLLLRKHPFQLLGQRECRRIRAWRSSLPIRSRRRALSNWLSHLGQRHRLRSVRVRCGLRPGTCPPAVDKESRLQCLRASGQVPFHTVKNSSNRCRIVSCSCSCACKAWWCQHVVAVCLMVTFYPPQWPLSAFITRRRSASE